MKRENNMIYDEEFYRDIEFNQGYAEKLEYLSPQSIGYIKLTEEECKNLRKVLNYGGESALSIGLGAGLCLLGAIICRLTDNKAGNTFYFLLAIAILLFILLILTAFLPKGVQYKGAFRGKVFAKETQQKIVGTHGDNVLRPYFYESGLSGRKQTYYYITVETEEKYKAVRHISCTKEDYERLKFGDTVTVVYIGGDFLVGFPDPK